MDVNHWPCFTSWQSLGPDVSHTEQGRSFTRSMCVFSDFTIYAMVPGHVKFEFFDKTRKRVSIVPAA
jgi:hypothetical protein